MSKRNKILGTMFSFFISFFLFLLLVAGFAKVTLMNQGYLLYSLDQADYYAGIAQSVNEDFKKGAGAAGFDPAIYEGFVTEEEVRDVSTVYIHEYFENGTAEISTETFRTRLSDYLHEQAQEQGSALEEIDEQRLNIYIDLNAQGYEKFLSFPFLKYIVMAIDMLDKVILFMLAACAGVVCFASLFLYLLHLKKRELANMVSSALFGASLMSAVLPSIVLISGTIRKVSLQPESYYKFFVGYLQGYFWYLLLAAAILFLSGLLIVLFEKRMRFRKH